MSEFRDELDRIVDQINARGHASILARDPADQQIMERIIANYWADAMRTALGANITSIRSNPKPYDAPDCFAMYNGKELSIEVTELVDSNILAKIDKARKVGRNLTSSRELFDDAQWTAERLRNEIEARLNKKNARYSSKGESFDVLVIYTAENWLSPKIIETTLAKSHFAIGDAFKSAYLLSEYYPGYAEHWPLFTLYGTI